MSKLPLLPARVAYDLRRELKGFVSTQLYVRDVSERAAIEACLFEDSPMLQGPFVRLRMPYKAATKAEFPLNPLLFEHPPFEHQLAAFKRLKHEHAEPTIVTTGTGSGKTECFLLPLMDYIFDCKMAGKSAGIKAIVMYPMNALIDDQGERFTELARTLNAKLSELGISHDRHIRVGRYTGGAGKNKSLAHGIIDHREELVRNPPDILLTNYRMLDLLLFRPEEQNLWNEQTRSVLKYLVLDEVHTFDGAQGADVACLIRRLKLKLGGGLVPVATSATVGSNSKEDQEKLIDFCSTIFGQEVPLAALVGESYEAIEEYLPSVQFTKIPSKPLTQVDLLTSGAAVFEAYIERLCTNWGAPVDREKLGAFVKTHVLTRSLLTKLNGKWMALSELANSLKVEEEVLVEFLDLVAWSRTQGERPVFNLDVQSWLQESKYLLRELTKDAKFVRPFEVELENYITGSPIYLPAVHCDDCGLSGWLSVANASYAGDPHAFQLERQLAIIQKAFASEQAVVLFPAGDVKEDPGLSVIDLNAGVLYRKADGSKLEKPFKVLIRPQKSSDKALFPSKAKGRSDTPQTCPHCESSLRLKRSSVSLAVLNSLASQALLGHGANPSERKLLMFNDSVQDANHQAGYMSAKSFRFNYRRFVQSISSGESISLAQFEKELLARIDELIKNKSETLWEIVPQDLYERWLKRNAALFELNAQCQHELRTRLLWELRLELTLRSNLGWSLKKGALLVLNPSQVAWQGWLKAFDSVIARNPELSHLREKESFCWGLWQELAKYGSIYFGDLKDVYKRSNFNTWYYSNIVEPHLHVLFGPRDTKLKLVCYNFRRDEPNSAQLRFMVSNSKNWFSKWITKHAGGELKRESIAKFFDLFSKELIARSDTDVCSDPKERFGRDDLLVLEPEKIEVESYNFKHYRCGDCKKMELVPHDLEIGTFHCTDYYCEGEMTESKESSAEYIQYMHSLYGRPPKGLFARAHTGQLAGEERRRIEAAFKDDLLPGQQNAAGGRYNSFPVNVLTCTPTLEMGIDIGSLSIVVLRGFPPSISAARQRLGRAGRSSGNALQVVFSRQTPHDLYFWKQPDLFFNGAILPPACRFRNPQLLLRQFHAYLLDCYSSLPENSKAKLKVASKETFLASHYWKGFLGFIREKAAEKIADFSKSAFIGGIIEGPLEQSGFESFLKSQVGSAAIAESFEDALARLDSLRKKSRSIEEQKPEQLELAVTNGEVTAELYTEMAKVEQKQRDTNWQKRMKDDVYVLQFLANEGLLPNYAFAKDGVSFSASVWSPRRAQNDLTRIKATQLGPVARAASQGIREFAPGQHFYMDGVKVPVTMVEDFDYKKLVMHHYCTACGTLYPVSGGAQNVCEVCESDKVNLLNVYDFEKAYGSVSFEQAQIRDNEDIRERVGMNVITTINFNESVANSVHRTWVSGEEHVAFEYKTNSQISHLNLGVPTLHDRIVPYVICRDCGAVPEVFYDKRSQAAKRRFKDPKGFANRHSLSCQNRDKHCEAVPTVSVHFKSDYRSDTIRFFADSYREVPTIKAVLELALRVYLGGKPDHIRVESQTLTGDTGWVQSLLVYDVVPGGSGHLRSLMGLGAKQALPTDATFGILKSVMTRTLAQLKSCATKNSHCSNNGCYDCLQGYHNQFQHEQLSKEVAIAWLERFVAAEDWQVSEESLAGAVVNHGFDSEAEHDFVKSICSTEGQRKLYGVGQIRELQAPEGSVYKIFDHSGRDVLTLVPTMKKKIHFQKRSGYTKPDFAVISSQTNRVAAYLYIDGRDPHLKINSSGIKFVDDISLRSSLKEEQGVPVITITTRMLRSWQQVGDLTESDKHFLPQAIAQLLSPQFNKDMIELRKTEAHFVANLFQLIANEGSLEALWPEQNLAKNYAQVSAKDFHGFVNAIGKSRSLSERQYGGLLLTNAHGDYELEMAISKDLVMDSPNTVSKDYEESWSLYWMLWNFVGEAIVVDQKKEAA